MIGIFDSGSGGLTVLKAIREKVPSVDVLYFGDLKHAPYGERDRAEIADLTVKAFKLLSDKGATSIVSACNSVSASMTISLYDAFSLDSERLIEMVGPTVSAFKNSSAKVLLCATPATIDSRIYQNAFSMIGKEITAVPIPGLAGMIEKGEGKDVYIKKIKESFSTVLVQDHDVLVLACTHYPLIQDVFTEAVGQIHLFDPAEMVAERVESKWWPREAGNGTLTFMLSEDSQVFRDRLEEMFPGSKYEVSIV